MNEAMSTDRAGHRRNAFDRAAAGARCLSYRRRILDISQQVTALHIAPAFSCVEIVDALYNGVMRREGEGAAFLDVFLMSKGHGCMIQYVILEQLGVLARADLDSYCKPEGQARRASRLRHAGHCGFDRFARPRPRHRCRSGLRREAEEDGHAGLLRLSDGEFQEGSTWEAMLTAANLGLSNLVVLHGQQ